MDSRSYLLGFMTPFACIFVGRQYRHDGQARAALLDEFMPRTHEHDGGR